MFRHTFQKNVLNLTSTNANSITVATASVTPQVIQLFNLQLKFRLYTTVHFQLEEFRISLKSSLSTQSLCCTISLRV